MSHSRKAKRQQPKRVRCVSEKTGKVHFIVEHIARNPERMAGAGLVIAELEEEEVVLRDQKGEEKAEEEAKRKAEEEARLKAEAEAKAKAEEEARKKAEEEVPSESPAEEKGGHVVTTLRSKDHTPMSRALDLMGGMDKEDLKAFVEGETRKGVQDKAAELIGE